MAVDDSADDSADGSVAPGWLHRPRAEDAGAVDPEPLVAEHLREAEVVADGACARDAAPKECYLLTSAGPSNSSHGAMGVHTPSQ